MAVGVKTKMKNRSFERNDHIFNQNKINIYIFIDMIKLNSSREEKIRTQQASEKDLVSRFVETLLCFVQKPRTF